MLDAYTEGAEGRMHGRGLGGGALRHLVLVLAEAAAHHQAPERVEEEFPPLLRRKLLAVD